MEAPATGRCPHCDAPVLSATDAFCCTGCEVAWNLVHEAGLEAYYAKRAVAGVRPSGLSGAWEAVEARPQGENACEVSLVVDGLRCASCTWVVERLLERTDGVQEATVSYATGRTRVVFDPAKTTVRDLAEVISTVGYSPRPLDAPAPSDDLLGRLGVAAFCTANLMLLSASLYAGWADGMEVRFQALFQWGALALATPVALYAAAPFFQGAWRGLRVGAIGMDVPIALAVTVLYGHGVAQTLLGAEGYLDSLGMLVTLLLAGRVLERRGRRAAAEASAAIAAALPISARRRTEQGVEDVPVAVLEPGDIVEIGAGEEVPADGTVVDGRASVQMALVTGEAEPVAVEAGAALVAGASVEAGSVGLRVERVGQDTVAMRMAEAVREATSRPMPPNPADRLAPAFTVATVVVALLAGWAWTALVGVGQGIEVAVAVLVVACPCALGLSVPLAVASGLGAVARRGVVLRDGGQLLALADAKTLAMDKTGTVTGGQPVVLAASDEVLQLAAALDRSSRHPIARALLAESDRRGLPLAIPTHVEEVPGVGMRGEVLGRSLVLRSGGPGCVVLEEEGQPLGLIRLGDEPREDARDAVAMLSKAGLRTLLLSGDHADATARIGAVVGVDVAVGGLAPEQKAERVRALEGPVVFVGDGLNDGSALAAADIGLAMGSGVTSSLLVADGVVTQPALRPVVAAVAAAHATRAAVRSNLRRALVYNGVAVAAAVLGFVNPLVAAVLMPLSSAMVVAGALSVDRRLRAVEARWTSS
ncbi:MAG: cadmium-translocating P-type ATPase [Alphaproteobacteria bacterium]|nr:cadmium-translocating P-type ATPase [Alphaproteobacteria bacterium]